MFGGGQTTRCVRQSDTVAQLTHHLVGLAAVLSSRFENCLTYALVRQWHRSPFFTYRGRQDFPVIGLMIEGRTP